MRYGIGAGFNSGYWIDVNDVANTGVLTHAYDDSEVFFFPPRVRCACYDSQPSCSNGGDAYTLKIVDDRQYRGNYCDQLSSSGYKFICETDIDIDSFWGLRVWGQGLTIVNFPQLEIPLSYIT